MKKIDKDKFKNILTVNQIFNIVAELGGEPQMKNDEIIICKTICHCGSSHKLYYYDNSKMFKCYTSCQTAFDIFDLVCKCKNATHEKKIQYINGKATEREWNLGDGLRFVGAFFNYYGEEDSENLDRISDWDYLDDKINNEINLEEKKVEWKIYNDDILNNLSLNNLNLWLNEGISESILKRNAICFDPNRYGIVIPHYNADHELIGIRERFLLDEDIEYGKYRPAILNGTMYSHPLGLNLYNLDNSKNNIRNYGIAIVFEGEKSPLKYASYFGEENDISVATCGSHITDYQMSLLLNLGVKEVIIAFDRQFQEKGDKEFVKWTESLSNIRKKYGSYCTISFMFDTNDLLDYKASPIDASKDIFLRMFKERI